MRRVPQTPEEMRNWLIKVIYAKAADYHRKTKRLRQHEELILNSEDERGHELIDRVPSPSSAEDFSDVEVHLWLDSLPEQERDVLIGLILRDQTEQEVAREIGISRQSVSRLKQQAIQRLRDEMVNK